MTLKTELLSKVNLLVKITVPLLLAVTFSSIFSNASGAAGGTYSTVGFAENASPSDSVFTTETQNTPSPLTPFSVISPAFVKSGYSFVEWNTQPDGLGVTYADGATYDFTSPLTLYAVWKVNAQSVTFEENAFTSDSVAFVQLASTPTALKSFATLSPAFANSGFDFLNWNTLPSGLGSSYSDGAIFSFSSPIVLYAIWQSIPSATISFSANGGFGSIGSVSGLVGTALNIPDPGALTRTGYVFDGWNSQAAGSGVFYSSGQQLLLSNSETLYAQWLPDTYTLHFDAQGGAAVSQINYTVGQPSLTLPITTRVGYAFTGWFSDATSGTLIGGGGAAFYPQSSGTLYSQWQADSVVISFDLAGASGSEAPLDGLFGQQVILPSSSSMVRSGYSFVGWNTAADGSGTAYLAGDTLPLSSSMRLSAQWKAVPTSKYFGAIAFRDNTSFTLTSKIQQQVLQLAQAVKRHGDVRVTLYGYATKSQSAALQYSLARRRALEVAKSLKVRLSALGVHTVVIVIAGEVLKTNAKSPPRNEVEAFVR